MKETLKTIGTTVLGVMLAILYGVVMYALAYLFW